ncbi:MAG: MerR family DNA-binding transcriptional regulator [Gammaproteobacteria bacterium]|nr:MerR family DNA-binding transcriptional regulator [Gammaproteobacteria bacterium]
MDSRTYTISELSKEFGITTRTIRYYEDQGLISPGRHGRHRIYSRRDRTRLKLILRGKRLGLPLRDIGDIIDMYNTDRGEAGQLKHLCTRIKQDRAMLLQQRAEIDTMLREMDVIEAQCRSALAQLETA